MSSEFPLPAFNGESQLAPLPQKGYGLPGKSPICILLFSGCQFFIVWTFFALAALDIAVNAAAGPAAVATAMHVNGSELTTRALWLGALAGATKPGALAFVEFAGWAGLPTQAWVLLLLLAISFGICVLVTGEISNLVLSESPSELLVAAVVAAIPLGGECIGIYQCKLLSCFHQGGYEHVKKETKTLTSIFIAGLDALGGYVFARMAHNEGHGICLYNVAAAAEAVYGVITGLFPYLPWMHGWNNNNKLDQWSLLYNEYIWVGIGLRFELAAAHAMVTRLLGTAQEDSNSIMLE
ncbi:uncharacterized protein N7459_003414, partial [Penicillium hispanicum]|uniref:uncharacterized protein n=1 Tax=Penicillium hispanicum TaxID=1080232 RepID=UPI00253FC71B